MLFCHMERFILIIGTFDTKAEELNFIKDQILARGLDARTLDAGVLQRLTELRDIPMKSSRCRGQPLHELVSRRDRGSGGCGHGRGAAKAPGIIRSGDILLSSPWEGGGNGSGTAP